MQSAEMSLSVVTLLMWIAVAIIATLGVMSGIAAADTTLPARKRWLFGAGCAVATVVVLCFFAGGGLLVIALASAGD